MYRLPIYVALFAIFVGPIAAFAGETHVDGYYRKDGAYVAPHWRTTPDSSYNNNWSTAPNINPHTGQSGTREPRFPDLNPSYQAPGAYGSQGGFGGSSGWPSRRR